MPMLFIAQRFFGAARMNTAVRSNYRYGISITGSKMDEVVRRI
jgi:hypothetical protein